MTGRARRTQRRPTCTCRTWATPPICFAARTAFLLRLGLSHRKSGCPVDIYLSPSRAVQTLCRYTFHPHFCPPARRLLVTVGIDDDSTICRVSTSARCSVGLVDTST